MQLVKRFVRIVEHWTRGRRNQRIAFRAVGKNLHIGRNCVLVNPELMALGNNVYIGEDAHISSEMTIGSNILIGPRSVIIGGNHIYGVMGRSIRFLHPKKRENGEPISIEDEVWCGAQVIILGNVTLGIGCVIGAGSVVARRIPPFTVAVGNNCRPIRRIFSDSRLGEHLVQLGYREAFAAETTRRRIEELSGWGLDDLPVVDNTADYWEYREMRLATGSGPL